jgi:hypothetical protein
MVVGGEPPNPIDPPPGCRFHTRCPHATDICHTDEPPLAIYPNGHLAACHHPLNVTAQETSGTTRSPLSPLSATDTMPGAPGPARASAAADAPPAAAPGGTDDAGAGQA